MKQAHQEGASLQKLQESVDALSFSVECLRERNAALEAALREAEEWANRIAHDERVTGWVHGEDYGLYCLLANCSVDFKKVLSSPAQAPGDAA